MLPRIAWGGFFKSIIAEIKHAIVISNGCLYNFSAQQDLTIIVAFCWFQVE